MYIGVPEIVQQYYLLSRDVLIHGIVIVILLDILTGMVKAFVQHKLNSSVSLQGLVKHILIIVLLTTVYPYLIFIGYEEVAGTIILFFLLGYATSVVENLSAMGVPFPKDIVKRLEKAKKLVDEGEETNEPNKTK